MGDVIDSTDFLLASAFSSWMLSSSHIHQVQFKIFLP